MGYRFRVDDGKLVLQVYEPPKVGPYCYDREGTWRDASVADIPVNDPFTRERPDPERWDSGLHGSCTKLESGE